MATSIKRVPTKKKSAAHLELEETLNTETKTQSTGARARKSALDNNKNEIENQLAAVKSSGDTIWIHNISGAEFHTPPTTFKTDDSDTAEVFEVGEVRPFDKSEIENKRFKKCLMDRKLRIVTEKEVTEIEKARDKAAKRTGKAITGLAESGLPKNTKAAMDYIWSLDDIDQLEAYADADDREIIQQCIEEKIEELESGEFQD